LTEKYVVFVVYSQNVGFGLPSTFDWMEKYVINSSIGNPFDIFDPLANVSAQRGWFVVSTVLDVEVIMA